MDSTELAEHLEDLVPGTAYYELLICDLDTARGAWWACNLDGREIDPRTGCPDHRPTDIPGLARSTCDATPPHAPTWTADGDHQGYGSPCHQCMYDAIAADLAKATKTDRCYHWPWRRWTLTHKICGWLYTSGICASGGGIKWGGGCDRCQDALPRPRGERPYILFVARETWRCWLRGHRRGEPVGFGFCGKCVPWTCCGSQTEAHVLGCAEDYRTTAAS